MDVGIFKASKTRLVLWIIIPPLLITLVGLSSYSMRQRAVWKLEQTRAMSDIMPDVIQAREDVHQLYDSLGLSAGKRITSGDQLIALLEESARKRNISLRRTQILERDKEQGREVPVISAIMEATGELNNFQLFLNDVKSSYSLVSARSIVLNEGREEMDESSFQLKVVFDLLLVNEVMKSSGG